MQGTDCMNNRERILSLLNGQLPDRVPWFGDLAMADVIARVPGPTILWGGLPDVLFTPATSDGDFQSHVIAMLRLMRREPRFVLGVADQVPPDGLIERVRSVAGLCDRYGRYET